MTNNQPPELLSDKELREKLREAFERNSVYDEDLVEDDILDLINQQTQAAEKRGELRGRVDELQQLLAEPIFTKKVAANEDPRRRTGYVRMRVGMKAIIDSRLATLSPSHP